MELRQIKYFLAVVDFGTFLAAAEQVHVSQPTLSAGIGKLEESLGVKLLNRGSRRATLTPEGELFLVQARSAYEQLMSTKAKLSGESLKLRIGVLNTIPMAHLASLIRLYRNQYPHVFVEIQVAAAESLQAALRSKHLDAAFLVGTAGAAGFTPLFVERLKVVLPSHHPLASQREIELEQIGKEPFIERLNCEAWGEVHQLFKQRNINPVSVCRAENDDTILALVSSHLGVSIMPERVTPHDVSFRTIKNVDISRPIGIQVTPASPLNEQAQGFHEMAVEHLRRGAESLPGR